MWCRERESNPYGTFVPRDFKSRASANFATPAEFSSPRLWSTLNCLNSISHKSHFVNTLLRKNIDFFWFSEYNILVSLIFIILYSDFIRFMHRNFNPIIEESYPRFWRTYTLSTHEATLSPADRVNAEDLTIFLTNMGYLCAYL